MQELIKFYQEQNFPKEVEQYSCILCLLDKASQLLVREEASLLTNAGAKGQQEKIGKLIHKFSKENEDKRNSSNKTEPAQTETATGNLKRMLQERTISRSEVN